VIDFGKGPNDDHMTIARDGTKRDLTFSVGATPAGGSFTSSKLTVPGAWRPNIWTHVIWTLAPQASVPSAAWSVYIDGASAENHTGVYPNETDMTHNFLGRNAAGGAWLHGYLDTLIIQPYVVEGDAVATLYGVGPCMCACVYVCVYVCVRVYACVCML
jgi:hypothetical protein